MCPVAVFGFPETHRPSGTNLKDGMVVILNPCCGQRASSLVLRLSSSGQTTHKVVGYGEASRRLMFTISVLSPCRQTKADRDRVLLSMASQSPVSNGACAGYGELELISMSCNTPMLRMKSILKVLTIVATRPHCGLQTLALLVSRDRQWPRKVSI